MVSNGVFFVLFFVSLFTCFDHFIRVPLFSRSVHGHQLKAFFDTKFFLQEVLECNFSMGCIVGEIANDLESDPQTLSTMI